jgi:hypothetical protein
VDTARDFGQLQLRFVDRLQWRYELIRPLVLFADRTPKQRAEETQTHVETVRDLTRRFQKQGMLGLLPEDVLLVPKGKATRVPPAVVEELARLKALYTGFAYRELARIIFCTLGYRIHHQTIKKLWQQSPGAIQEALALGDYQGKRIWKLRGFSVTVAASFTARSLLHYWRTLYGYACACLVSGAFCHVD